MKHSVTKSFLTSIRLLSHTFLFALGCLMYQDLYATKVAKRLLLSNHNNETTKRLNTLIESKADTAQISTLLSHVSREDIVHFKDRAFGVNFLHKAILFRSHAETVAVLCNADVSPNEMDKVGNTPVHYLFSSSDYQKNEKLKIGTIFFWTAANPARRNKKGETCFDTLTPKSPELLAQMKALSIVVPRIKKEKDLEYQQNILPLLTSYVTAHPGSLIKSYMGRLTPLPYHEVYGAEIETRMLHALES